METTLINEICRLMKGHLSAEQNTILEGTLRKVFKNFNIPEQSEQLSPQSYQTNTRLLNLFISAKKIEGCSAKTLKYYSSTLLSMINTLQKNVCDVKTDDIRFYLSNYQDIRNSSKATLDNIRRIISSFYSLLEDESYILKSPARRIHKVKSTKFVKETLSDEELERLRDQCRHSRDLAMIDLLISTGIRVGELVNLNRSDINFSERECIVLGKGDKERRGYFDARAKIHLQHYLAARRDTNPALFVGLTAPWRRLSIAGVERFLAKLGSTSHVDHVHPHKFRRTMATMAIGKGMPIEQLQKLLGHTKIDTTLHYAIVNETKIDTTLHYAIVNETNIKLSHQRYVC